MDTFTFFTSNRITSLGFYSSFFTNEHQLLLTRYHQRNNPIMTFFFFPLSLFFFFLEVFDIDFHFPFPEESDPAPSTLAPVPGQRIQFLSSILLLKTNSEPDLPQNRLHSSKNTRWSSFLHNWNQVLHQLLIPLLRLFSLLS